MEFFIDENGGGLWRSLPKSDNRKMKRLVRPVGNPNEPAHRMMEANSAGKVMRTRRVNGSPVGTLES